MKKKANIKDCIEEDTIDLGMTELQDVPVKEIAAFPKIKSLDLSNNQLVQLNDYFSIYLTHINKLDLSHNKLTSLPDNFGSLVNLKYLDLSKNRISTVPLSFGNLKALNWLDMSENPLVPKISEVVGVSVNAADCRIAAKKLVAFMAEINKRVNVEKERIKEVKKIQAEQAEIESLKRKEKKDKKKKKKMLKAMENGDNKTDINLENDEFLQQQIHSYSKVSRNTRPNIVWRFLAAIFKICFYTTLFTFFTFFVIRLLDEPTYITIRLKINKWISEASVHLPKGVITLYNEVVNLSSLYSSLVWKQLNTFGHGLIVSFTEWYSWFSTDETVQLYLDSLWNFFHILYVQFRDLSLNLYVKFEDWLQS